MVILAAQNEHANRNRKLNRCLFRKGRPQLFDFNDTIVCLLYSTWSDIVPDKSGGLNGSTQH